MPKRLHAAFLLLLAGAYLFLYSRHPFLPGAHGDPGWWGWADQGGYLREAEAIARLDGHGENYFYPPFYPALAAPFTGLLPEHPFLPANLALFLLFAHFFTDLARRYVGWPVAAALFAASFLPERVLSQVWLEPWTTTVVGPAFAYLLREADRWDRGEVGGTPARMALAGGAWSAAFLARPADGLTLAPVILALLWRAWTLLPREGDGFTGRAARFAAPAAAMAAAGAAGVAAFAAFNLAVHGSPGGNYVALATQKFGFHPFDVAEKAVSLFLDPGPLYNVPGTAIVLRVKWFALFVPAALLAAYRGGWFLRLLTATACLHLALYAAYADFIPPGVWYFHNVHYIKWVFPYGALLAAWWAREAAFPGEPAGRRRAEWAASLALGALLLCVRIDLSVSVPDPFAIPVRQQPGSVTVLPLAAGEPVDVDKVNLPTLFGPREASYFTHDARLRIDGGPELLPFRDFRLLPAQQGVDLLLLRPARARTLELHHPGLAFGGPAVARPLRYSYSLGEPAWLSAAP